MSYWKINPKKEYTDRIQAIGRELTALQDGDSKKNKAVFNAKWFELYQIAMKVFCKYVCEEDLGESTENVMDRSTETRQQTGYAYINEKKVPEEVQEAFSQMMDEVIRLYDPAIEPDLYKFMNSRFGSRYKTLVTGQRMTITATEYERQKNGAIVAKEVKQKVRLESLDAMTNSGNDRETDRERSNPDANTPSTTADFDQLNTEYMIEGIFLDLAAEIISMTSKVKLTSRVNYYRLFYTSQMISFLKIRNSKPYFQHESKVYKSLKEAFVDYCVEQKCETLEQIQAASLRWLQEVVDREVESNIRIPVPIEEEVELTYLNRKEMEKAITPHTLKAQKSYYNNMFREIRKRM